MIGRPDPTLVYHFTHARHLVSIAQSGLVSDTRAHAQDLLTVEIGNAEIKDQRRRRTVPVPPRGVVADYVPFYFAPRSPMMYAIHKDNVPTYRGGCDDLVYLVSTVDRLVTTNLPVLVTDRNAVLSTARFQAAEADLDGFVDWPLMREQYWYNTPSDPDRKERRMAECLVHGQVPWGAFTQIAARDATRAMDARATLADVGVRMSVDVRPTGTSRSWSA